MSVSLHLGELAWEAVILLTCGLERYHAWGCLASGVQLCLLRHLQLIKALFPELSIVSEVIWAWLWKLLYYQFMLTLTYSILKVLSSEAIKNGLPYVAIVLDENFFYPFFFKGEPNKRHVGVFHLPLCSLTCRRVWVNKGRLMSRSRFYSGS